MKFNEAIAISTIAADVEGIPKIMYPMVRRKMPPVKQLDVRTRKKKKKKAKDEAK